MKQIYIVGTGPGDKKYMLQYAKEKIENADLLIGGRRNIETIREYCTIGNKNIYVIGRNLKGIIEYIKKSTADNIVITASGDPSFYGIMNYIKNLMPDYDIKTVPGINAVSYLAARIGIPWDDANVISFHGRLLNGVESFVLNNKKTFIYTDNKNTPDIICKKLAVAGYKKTEVFVGENLSYQNEKITEGTVQEISKMKFSALSVMLVINNIKISSRNYNVPGIPDKEFIRGNLPMTKEEIRALLISKLRIKKEDTIWDIGAGTGSVTVECALAAEKGKVTAFEKEKEGINLIRENCKKFKLSNVKIVEGEAPGSLKDNNPDVVFIGGSGGKLKDIIEYVYENTSCRRISLNAVTIETACHSIEYLESAGFINCEIISVQISKGKKAGKKHLMQSLNNVYIISAERKAGK